MNVIHVQTREQLECCFAIRMKVFVEEQKVPVEEEIDEYDESPEACSHLLVLDGDKPAATGRWKVFEDGIAKLQRIAVMPEYRSHGLGRLIVTELEQWAKEAGMKACILDGQCVAEGFYHKLGYTTISEEPFLDAGILHVRMSKSL